MKLSIFFFLVMVLLIMSTHGTDAKGVTEDIGNLVLKYDNRFNAGRDLRLQVQVNFNISKFEIIIDRENDSLSVYFAMMDNWFPGDWIETNVQAELIQQSYEYQGRIIAYPQNRNLTVVTHFFNFKVLAVLDLNQTVAATSFLGLLFLIPFATTKDRTRIELGMWNKLSLGGYLKYYPCLIADKLFTIKVGLILLVTELSILGGFYLVTKL